MSDLIRLAIQRAHAAKRGLRGHFTPEEYNDTWRALVGQQQRIAELEADLAEYKGATILNVTPELSDKYQAVCVDNERLRAERNHYRDKYMDGSKRIAELEAITAEAVDDARLLKIDNKRLRAALDEACETTETRAKVGMSIDYANGFLVGMQCQRLHAKSARAEALKGSNP